MKNSNDIIGNRTRDLPACSAVPQPSVSPCVLTVVVHNQLSDPVIYVGAVRCNFPYVLSGEGFKILGTLP
jgi:hypothetical protein